MAPPTLSDEAIDSLIGLAFDHLCTKRVADFVSVDEIMTTIDTSLTPERVMAWQGRFGVPQRTRLIEAAKKSTRKLGVWLPDAARDEIAAMLGEPAPLPAAMVDEAVASERVRDEVKAMLQDTLTSFVQRATATLGGGEEKPSGAGGLLRGVLSKGAAGVAQASKGLLGGLGGELQRQLQDKVREFVDGSVSAVQTRIADKLKSTETAAQLGKRRREAFIRALERTEAEVAAWVEKGPHAKVDKLLPIIVQHNAARAELREVVTAEVGAVLAELSKQTVGELLDELGLRGHIRATVKRRWRPLLREVFAEPAFADWWQKNVGA